MPNNLGKLFFYNMGVLSLKVNKWLTKLLNVRKKNAITLFFDTRGNKIIGATIRIG